MTGVEDGNRPERGFVVGELLTSLPRWASGIQIALRFDAGGCDSMN